MARKLLKYGLTLGIGLAAAVALAAGRGAFAQSAAPLKWQYLSDGFFVVAVMLISAGLLAFVASDGLFDMVSFGVKKVLSLVHRDESRLSGTFYEYKLMKQGKRGGHGFLLVTGAVFLAVAAACLLLYMGA